jgi:3-hydroxymyristoyl/3-hydroxydecanoyl-(acyl carrier protein) dehydratase
MAAESQTRLFHRFPFVLVDRPREVKPGGASSLRLLSIDDALHEGMAADGLARADADVAGSTFAQSLLLEAMAQAAALFAEEGGRRTSGMLVGFRSVTFGRPPRTGDRLEIETRYVQRFGDIVRVAGRVTESGETLAEGEILLSLGDAPKE